MIFGDPFVFAVQFDTVRSWNEVSDVWRNGIFSFYIDGERVFSGIEVVELRASLSVFVNAYKRDLIFCLPGLSGPVVYRDMQDYAFGEKVLPIPGVIDLSCTAMEDSGCFVYFLRQTNLDRVVWSVDAGANVKDFSFDFGTVFSVLKDIYDFVGDEVRLSF